MDGTLNKCYNKFATIANLNNLASTLKIEILCDTNINYKIIIFTHKKEIKNEV